MEQVKYRDSLAERVERLKTAKALIEGQMIDLLKDRIRKAVDKQIVVFKEDAEAALNENPNKTSIDDAFWICDDVFDPIDEKEENQELRLEALISVVFERLKDLGWEDFRYKAKTERARLFGRLLGIRTHYIVEVELPLSMSVMDMELLNKFGMNGMQSSKQFIDRIKTGVLRPSEDPTSRFTRMAKEAGVTPGQAHEDVERVHTGQSPKYIKIERNGDSNGRNKRE